MGSWRRRLPAATVAGLAAGLLAVAAAHHAAEIQRIDHVGGPVSAFALDTAPALALFAAAYLLDATDLEPSDQWLVVAWSTVGGVLFAAVTAGTILVRELEGRTVAEPAFPLLVSTGAGFVAGFVAGYFYARARRDAARAERTSHAFSFVNSVLRHDVRNSLGIIRGRAAMVASDAGDAAADHAETIREQADDVLHRIDHTDDIAHTITGDADLHTVDVTDAVETAAGHVDDAYSADVTTDTPDAAYVAANDAVRAVVDNLVENAAEHNDADDPRVDVDVTVHDDAVRIRVADNGPGVDRDVLDTDDGGLDLVQTLVDHYGGDVSVADDDADGTTFVVELPRAPPGERPP